MFKKTNKPYHVLMIGDISQSGFREFSKGFAEYSRTHGGWVLYFNSPFYRNPNLKEITAQDIRRWTIHGIVDGITDSAKTREILSLNLPTIVACGMQKEVLGEYSIIVDNAMIAEMGAGHFIEKKFRDFAYCGFDYMYWSRDRGAAFSDIVAKAGGSFYLYKQPQMEDVYSWESELPHLVNWLKTLPKPVGLMACNDDRGQHVLEACRVAELHVPEEIAVIGVDNDDFICDLTNPSLTSICLNNANIGYRAAEILDRLLDGQKVQPQKLLFKPTGIAVRQSTDILAIDDDDVKRAIRFVRLNCLKPINVADVAAHLSMTIRTLDRRFSASIGRSVHSEIVRMRIEHACHLLVETNLSISEIAVKVSYSELKYLTQAFTREKGIGPLAYRKTYGNVFRDPGVKNF